MERMLLSSHTDRNGQKSRKSDRKMLENRMALGPRVALAWTRPPGSDHFLLHDLLHADGGLLRGLVVVGHPVPACVAHDRIGRDHRATRRTRHLGLSPRLRFALGGPFA